MSRLSDLPRITFGIIVLNGEPFTRYNLTALYPFAHEIIVVEGAAPSARDFATSSGHSADGTLDILRRFQREEDPENKVIVVTAEDEGHADGFWTEKDEMSQAYARRTTGSYLWQVDMDEFYRPEDMQKVIKMLADDPAITAATFQVKTFWGGLTAHTDGIFLRWEAQNFHRLFAWEPGYEYVTHRPPTVRDDRGRDLRARHAISGPEMARCGIFLYHYSLVFPFQIDFKLAYYGNMDRSQNIPLQHQRQRWHDNFFSLADPLYVDDTSVLGEPSWLVSYPGPHPQVIRQLWQDIKAGSVTVRLRPTSDIERLLHRPGYRVLTRMLPLFYAPREWSGRIRRAAGRLRRRLRR